MEIQKNNVKTPNVQIQQMYLIFNISNLVSLKFFIYNCIKTFAFHSFLIHNKIFWKPIYYDSLAVRINPRMPELILLNRYFKNRHLWIKKLCQSAPFSQRFIFHWQFIIGSFNQLHQRSYASNSWVSFFLLDIERISYLKFHIDVSYVWRSSRGWLVQREEERLNRYKFTQTNREQWETVAISKYKKENCVNN